MSPVCRALSLFGIALWLMPHVSPGWGFAVTGALPQASTSRADRYLLFDQT